MVLTETPNCNFGNKAIDFSLPGTDRKTWTLDALRGENGLLIMFICNHCPYVQAIRQRIVRDTRELKDYGIESVGIMSNDPTDYPQDSFQNMQLIAERYAFPFPYLLDASQQTAKDYGAVCTPDFFGYNSNMELQYRGRLDASDKHTASEEARRELFEALTLIARTGHGPEKQISSVGCSIKWISA